VPFVAQLKSAAVRAVTASGVERLLQPLHRRAAVVFMLHRFTDPDRGIVGHDPARVRELLAHLRRRRHHLVSLDGLCADLAAGTPPPNAVAFTIDDGYAEQASIAGPLFAEFDCPVTTFVTTGFLDGAIWFWWDQIEFIFQHTGRPSLSLDLGDRQLRYDLRSPAERQTAQDAFIALCKTLTEAAKLEAIRTLAVAADVVVPDKPPAKYEPMSWDELRACERSTMRFGPHTVTHPVLARTDDAQARSEIATSWSRLRAEAASPTAVFAYPNGTMADFGKREFDTLRELGLGGVTGVAGFATARRYAGPDGAFLEPRFNCPDSLPYFVQVVGGLERLKSLLRGEA